MKHKEVFTLLTFYKFVDVEKPVDEVKKHYAFCSDIGMKGRIYIGTEGISATVTGNQGQIKAYKMYLSEHDLFSELDDVEIKSNKVDGHKFPRMIVKHREEIVVLGKKYSKEEIEKAGNRMQIEELKDLIENGNPDDYVILDMRNNHEYKLGHFKNAIPANTLNFRNLDEQIDDYKKEFGDKKIITYCTGGIRCEKSTVMLQNAGLKNTYQLDGGVVKYINSFDDGNWLGNLYVFDDRVSARVGSDEMHTVIGECIYSGKKTDNCENCRYSPCNARIIASKGEYKKHLGFCSEECFKKGISDILLKNVDFDPINYKMERAKIKIDSSVKDDVIKAVAKHLTKKMEGVTFSHKTSQKEDFIMD